MTDLTIHSAQTAPDGSRAILEGAQKALGFTPNLSGVLAEAPAALEGYTTLAKILDKSSFTAEELQTVLMTANYLNECAYCMAAHSTIAKGAGVRDEIIEGLRNNTPLPDAKLEALRVFTRAALEKRGWVDEADIAAFTEAGYGNQQILEVITGLALKTISNYANHIAETPLDAAFSPFKWDAAA